MGMEGAWTGRGTGITTGANGMLGCACVHSVCGMCIHVVCVCVCACGVCGECGVLCVHVW